MLLLLLLLLVVVGHHGCGRDRARNRGRDRARNRGGGGGGVGGGVGGGGGGGGGGRRRRRRRRLVVVVVSSSSSPPSSSSSWSSWIRGFCCKRGVAAVAAIELAVADSSRLSSRFEKKFIPERCLLMGGHLELVIEIGIQDLLVPQLATAGIRGTYEQSHECTCVWDFRNGGPYTQECNASGSVLGPTLYMQTPYLHNYHRCICAIRSVGFS